MLKLTGNRCQGPTCGEYFNGSQPFDKHRIGSYAKPRQPSTRRCAAVPQMEAAEFWMTDNNAQRAARHWAAGFPARGSIRAMVQPTPAPDAPETRKGAAP